jgi:hypothetical protein
MPRAHHLDDEAPQPPDADPNTDEGTDPDDESESPNPGQKGTREAPLGGI